MFSINFCKTKSIHDLMKFIGDHWSEEHILARDINFMKWQHYEKEKKFYNFIIAKKNKDLIGCHGFISHSNFSKKLLSNNTIWMINWFAIKGTPNPGLSLIFFPQNNLRFNRIGTIGCNKKAKTIYKKMGFKVGNMKHYFIINSKIRSFKIIKLSKKINKTSNKDLSNKSIKYLKSDLRLKIFGNNTDELVKKYAKDETFFQNRYIKHPYYKYKIYLIYSFKNVVGFFVIRVCKFKKSKALRIVDFFGHEEALVGINFALEKLLVETKAEYIDFYEYGIKNSIMLKSGFVKNMFDNKIIIPNYFEPFVKRNIKLGWAIKTNNLKMTPMFKGDCDQDRPSLLRSKKLKNKKNL